jgi:hypothetical protein
MNKLYLILFVNRILFLTLQIIVFISWLLDLLVESVSGLPVCLGVLTHRATLARGPIFLLKKKITMDILLMWCNFKFEGVLFRNDSRHSDRVDSIWECVTN